MQWYRFRIVSGDNVTYHDLFFNEINHWENAQELKKMLEKNERKVSCESIEAREVKYSERIHAGDDIKRSDISLEDLFREARRLGVSIHIYYNNNHLNMSECFEVWENVPKRIYLNGEWDDLNVKEYLRAKLEVYAKSTWQQAFHKVAESTFHQSTKSK